MKLTENAEKILFDRYLRRDASGHIIETPQGMLERVATCVASAERTYGGDSAKWEARFHELMDSLDFLPNSPTLMNAGKPDGQLAACFVLPVNDSMKSIFDTLKNAAMILKSGGGTGFSFSRLRPSTDTVSSTGGGASGPVSFMRIYNTATDVIKQGGTRRGANMGILRVDHPDILDFIRMKRNSSELENFNISVAITDKFMTALRNNRSYRLRNPHDDRPSGRLNAKDVFDEIVESAWLTGDPGVVFIDRINKSNPTPHIGEIESTNPCGEQPLLPNEACILGSINLSNFVYNKRVEFDKLKLIVRYSVRFLDNAIDVNRYPVDEIREMHLGNRKIGLGVMGWADMLIALGLPYESEEALKLAGKIMKCIRDEARNASAALAEKRGAFPNFKGSKLDRRGWRPMRNATLTTIAPTGTLSIIAGCSSGIEPIFAIANRRMAINRELQEVNRHFFDIARARGFYSPKLHDIVMSTGSIKNVPKVPADIRRLFKTAHEISVPAHVHMQAAFQKYTDNAVSKTINLSADAERIDVEEAFLLAWHLGCKGVTVYRYGSSNKEPLQIKSSNNRRSS